MGSTDIKNLRISGFGQRTHPGLPLYTSSQNVLMPYTDRLLVHCSTIKLADHPLMAAHTCSLRIFTATRHILHSQPQDTSQCNSNNMLLVLLVTLNVHLEELCSLQQCREIVFSHTGLATVHEFYEWLQHWKLHILQHYQRVHAKLPLQYCL